MRNEQSFRTIKIPRIKGSVKIYEVTSFYHKRTQISNLTVCLQKRILLKLNWEYPVRSKIERHTVLNRHGNRIVNPSLSKAECTHSIIVFYSLGNFSSRYESFSLRVRTHHCNRVGLTLYKASRKRACKYPIRVSWIHLFGQQIVDEGQKIF